MKIPNELILFGEIYKIRRLTQKQMNKLDDDKSQGIIIPKKQLILLVDNKDMEETFWHEIGHYFLMTFEYKDNEQGAEAFGKLVFSILNQMQDKKPKYNFKITRKDTK